MERSDLLVCDPPTLERWVEALARADDEARGRVESAMDAVGRVEGLAPDDLGLLRRALGDGPPGSGTPDSPYHAIAHLDSARGPWLVQYDAGLVRALAAGTADATAVEDWAALADAWHEVDDSAAALTLPVAEEVLRLCRAASGLGRNLYLCYHCDGGNPRL